MDSDRMEAALKRMQADQIPARRAAIIVAVSTNEANNTFAIPRSSALPYPLTCYPYRQILKLERGISMTQPLSTAWTEQSGLMAWLEKEGYLDRNASRVWIAGKHQAVDSLKEPNNALARIFEYLMDQRYLAALGSFSIGPTQMYLAYSPITKGSSSIKGRFDTLDELFDFYMSKSARQYSGPWFDYLRTDVKFYPTPSSTAGSDPSSDTSVEKYLTNYQTGGVDWATDMWSGYAKSFLMSVKNTWNLMYKLGYTIS